MNYNLALSDETLLSIEKPERYIGNEVNSVFLFGDAVNLVTYVSLGLFYAQECLI